MSEEVNYKKDFCEKYFDIGVWELDVLNQVDVLLKDDSGNKLLYIEAKYVIENFAQHRQALAQLILTNKKQEAILSYVALIYRDRNSNDVLELVDCSEDSVMYNNDFNWRAEKPSNPSKDAIDRINDRLIGKITRYRNGEIGEFYNSFKQEHKTTIDITLKNFNVVYNAWKSEIKFVETELRDEQDIINLFLVDILNGTIYKQSIIHNQEETSLFNSIKEDSENSEEQDLIREGTKLRNYYINYRGGVMDGIICKGVKRSSYYTIADADKYAFFWKKYKRPPVKEEFLKILEHSATLYSDKYRKDTGGEYTPTCFVEKQNEILAKYYDLNEYIVFDPCCGVGNLENQFGKDYKQYCYLSTLEQTDVDICKIKDFENVIQFDYLKDKTHPQFKYKGEFLDINEICQRENRKLMVIMNPPYQRKREFKYDLAIEFFNKIIQLQPQVIVFYYMTESFLRAEVENYANSGYGIVSHIFSNARTTFGLSEWPISQVIFDKDSLQKIEANGKIRADRYEYNKKEYKLDFVKTYTYDNSKPSLLKEIDDKIKENQKGMVLGNVSYLIGVINLTNKVSVNTNALTTQNIKYCLLSKGLSFNSHVKYFERVQYLYKGLIDDISEELFSDAIMFSQFYKGNAFTNKGYKNFIVPFNHNELGCSKNQLNVLIPDLEDNLLVVCDKQDREPFDFREFFHSFEYSLEAKNLYNAALKIFKYYHSQEQYQNKDWNDSFYDITNAIMGKDPKDFRDLGADKDSRITKVKTTRGTKGFGRNTIKYAINSEYLPIFEEFFAARDTLAIKINKQLVEQGLLLWERENIY